MIDLPVGKTNTQPNEDIMKKCIVRFSRGTFHTDINLEESFSASEMRIEAIVFKDVEGFERFEHAFNTDRHETNGTRYFTLQMNASGPILGPGSLGDNRLDLDGVPIRRDPHSVLTPQYPLGMPSQHEVELAGFTFMLTVHYA
jgi:hypothetical protein